MKITMEFDRKIGEIIVAMAMSVPRRVTKEMSGEELVNKAFGFISTYGFSNMEIVDERKE